MGYNEIFTAINLIILTIALYLTLKKNKVEESLSNSEEHLNWKQLYTESMDEVRRVLKENKEIKNEVNELRPLKQRVEHLEKMLQGELDLIITIPLEKVIQNGNSQAVAQIRHNKLKTP